MYDLYQGVVDMRWCLNRRTLRNNCQSQRKKNAYDELEFRTRWNRNRAIIVLNFLARTYPLFFFHQKSQKERTRKSSNFRYNKNSRGSSESWHCLDYFISLTVPCCNSNLALVTPGYCRVEEEIRKLHFCGKCPISLCPLACISKTVSAIFPPQVPPGTLLSTWSHSIRTLCIFLHSFSGRGSFGARKFEFSCSPLCPMLTDNQTTFCHTRDCKALQYIRAINMCVSCPNNLKEKMY